MPFLWDMDSAISNQTMNNPIHILELALTESGVKAADAIHITLLKNEDKNFWDCAIATEETQKMEPWFIRVQVDGNGSRAVEIR
jgi:hypothetical protein